MFTGIIEEIGQVKTIMQKNHALQLTIAAKSIMADMKLGGSIAVNGVCLTVTEFNSTSFSVDVMPETFKATTTKLLTSGSWVNLERALAVGGRVGGHFVTGHVDGVGEIIQITPNENAISYQIKLTSALLQHCILKGSIAVDGISLTIFAVSAKAISISLIPHTVKNTSLATKKIGDVVNIENDLLSKYVYNLTKSNLTSQGINYEYLQQNGFI
ncbi:MAG: riboflavin synthase, alpha subunit [Pseudomonadota bacterium]|jgi:riboflavin synthase|nr:riboflavin synthase [Burkholderiales bacterium]